MTNPPRVLMVLGSYFPEVGGGGAVQSREVVRRLQGRAQFSVLATTRGATTPAVEEVDGVPVYHVPIETDRFRSKVRAAPILIWKFLQLARRCDIVHFHGFSQKNVLLTLLAKGLRKRVVLTLHTASQDEPEAVRARGRLRYWCYALTDAFVGVSPRQQQLFRASGLSQAKFSLITCGVDAERFHPGSDAQRRALRQELGLPLELPLILFVGFFSRDKGPHVLFEAWTRLQGNGIPSTGLVFVGATHPRYFEIDPELAGTIRTEARRLGLAERVVFVELTHDMEKYYRCADLFVLPSSRESMPMALLEAMASGLPCIASRLSGATETVVDHGVNGLLVEPGDVEKLAAAIQSLMRDEALRERLGRRAREEVASRYSIQQAATRHLELYHGVTARRRGGIAAVSERVAASSESPSS